MLSVLKYVHVHVTYDLSTFFINHLSFQQSTFYVNQLLDLSLAQITVLLRPCI